MKVKCEHCGAEISELDVKCPYCRGENLHTQKEKNTENNLNHTPQTIEELKKWYIAMNLPDENVTRFFIGKNYKHPKAFGIYKDEATENFIVYKNKASGERAVRYEGSDEAYAVNELYKKLKDEIYNQKHNNNNSDNNNKSNGRKRKSTFSVVYIFWIIFFLIFFIPIIISIFSPNRGYYKYNDDYYYYQDGSWYEYDDNYGWRHSYIDDYFKDHYSDYYYSSGYVYNLGIDRFEDSSYYVEPSSSDYDYDSSWDSSDSWDSSSTDWDSDW